MNQAVIQPQNAPSLPIEVDGIAVSLYPLASVFKAAKVLFSDGKFIFGRLQLFDM